MTSDEAHALRLIYPQMARRTTAELAQALQETSLGRLQMMTLQLANLTSPHGRTAFGLVLDQIENLMQPKDFAAFHRKIMAIVANHAPVI